MANNDPEIYKRVHSNYHEQEIVIAYNSAQKIYPTFEVLEQTESVKFGGVNVQIFKFNLDYIAYIQIGNKCAWTNFGDNDNFNSVVRELIVTAYNN